MTSEIKDILENMTTAAPEMEDYIGEDGLLYCGKCHTPKEAYFPEGKELFGRDRHPAECDCQRAAREQRQAAEEHRRHVEAVENLKQRAFADSAMQQWTFENDNGRNPQTGIARRYAEHWEEMQAENIGCLFWGNVGNGKSYLAGCIANALMEKEVPVYMTNFAVILGDLSPGFTGRNEYISRLCRYPLLIIDDFGMRSANITGLIRRTILLGISPGGAAEKNLQKIERDEDGFEYEMLAGHNRQNAAAIANRELPCIVKENLSDEDAWIYVIETNVLQRSFSEMLPSEKAAVLALRYSKMICQGRRNDIIEELKRLENPDEIRENPTSGTQCHRTKSRDILGAEYDLKGRAVANYLRINELITPLKRRIDDAEFPIVVAVQLSYLTEQEQQMVDDVLSGSEYKVNEGKVVLLREYTGKLTPERTEQILSGEFNRKPKKSTATAFKVKPAIYKKYFTTSISQKEFDSIVDEALALYFAQKGQESEQEAG